MDDIMGIKGIVEKIIDVLGIDVVGAPLHAKAESIKRISENRTNNELL